MRGSLKQRLNMLATRHRQSGEPDVFIHSLPRSGSTWLMELILTQPGFRRISEPLNLRKEAIRENLGLSEWVDLHREASKEKLSRYFSRLCTGELRDPRLNFRGPFASFYRPITRRTVFKIIHGGHEFINWFAEMFNGKVVLLLRHPVPVSLSRRSFPELEGILETEFAQFFSESQLALAERVLRRDNKLEKGVLDWCLRNSVALACRNDSWSIITYEQLVIDPAPVIESMARKLDLPAPDRILKRLPVPSRSYQQSEPETQEVLRAGRNSGDRSSLVEKWKKEVAVADLSRLEEIVGAFGLLDVYMIADSLPQQSYWIN